MEIHELHGVEGRGYYTEGVSPKVDILDNTPGAGGWFCFETTTFAELAMELQKIGFTATQILDARPTWPEGFDDRPWGEQQGQIDWLESRFDSPMEPEDFDDPRGYE